MKRYRSATVIVALTLAGCGPEGPHEFYRDALQARSEIVDSMSFVVDEESGKDFKHVEKRYRGRMMDISEKLTMYKTKMSLDQNFAKLRRDDFTPKRIDEDILAAMIDGVQAYANFTKNITYTNVRLNRELKRLNLVLEASVAKKIEEQLNENAAIISADSNEFPNLKFVIDTMREPNLGNIGFLAGGVGERELEKLDFNVNIKEMLDFKNDLNVKLPDLEPPALPERPAWIDDAYRRLLERNRNLPVLGGAQAAAFSARYTEALLLTNTSGQNLTDVNATLMYEIANQKSTQRVSEPTWAAKEMKQLALPPAEATKVRLDGTAKVGGNSVRFAVGLPNVPKKKEE